MLIAVLALAIPAGASANGFIAGSVEAEGEVIGGVEVCVESVSNTAGGGVPCVESESDGEWHSPELAPGTYRVLFYPGGLNYVAQYWNAKSNPASATPVTITEGTIPGIDADLEKGATISGTVTAAATRGPVGEVVVCASNREEMERCAETNAAGLYTVPGLSGGQWSLYFYSGETGRDLLSEPYPGNPVTVAPKGSTTGVDVALVAGGRIGGTVRLAASGVPLSNVRVCLTEALELFTLDCVKTPASGAYLFTGLPEGSFKVVFSPEDGELFPSGFAEELEFEPEAPDAYPTQWWDSKPNYLTAESIAVTPPAQILGIDGSLGPPPVAALPAPPVVPALVATKPMKKALVCHKGFVKRKVRGKSRCVKRHKPVRHKRHKKPHRA